MGDLLNQREMQELLQKQMEEDGFGPKKRAYNTMALNAAHFLLSGGDPEKKVDSAELRQMGTQLKKLGMKEYGDQCYGRMDYTPDQVRFEGFLLQHFDSLVLPDALQDQIPAMKEQLQRRMQERSETWGEYWLRMADKREDGRKKRPYQEKDESVYEYEASEEDWKLAACCTRLCIQQGGMPVTDADVKTAKNNVFAKLLLRNKRAGEVMRRGELANYMYGFNMTIDSFTYADEDQLKMAQDDTRELLASMRNYEGELSQDPKWRQVLQAGQAFADCEDLEDAAEKSAEVLLAVEAFTKGRKSNYNNKTTRDMVSDSLTLLAKSIPDARNNPCVKPLIGRFNDVRAHRLQSRVELPDYGYRSARSQQFEKKPERKMEKEFNVSIPGLNEKDGDTKNVIDKNGVSSVMKELYGM